MRNFVAGVLALLCLLPTAAFAQAAQHEQQFAYCSVNDSGRHNIWVSQIFPAPPNIDPMANDLATAFHAHVRTLGGSGDKQCVVSTREALETLRLKIAGIMGKRTFGIRVYDWHDVQWTPSAAMYARTAPAPAIAADSHVYCRTTDAQARKQVTSEVFVAKLPPPNDGERYAMLTRFAQGFARSAAASHGIEPDAMCIASDTREEADKSRDDYRHAFRFTGVKTIEMPWTPDPALMSPPPAPVPMQRPAPANPASGVPAPASVVTGAGANDDVEAEFWSRISKSRQIADYKDYLAAYPQGRHAPIARLEIRRLGGKVDASVVAPPAPMQAAPVPEQATPMQTQGGDLQQRIATEKFFQLPAGTGVSIERSGNRMIGAMPVMTKVQARRVAGSNQCRLRSESTAGNAGTSATSTVEGSSWAGLLPLESTMQSRSAFGTTELTMRTLSIDATQGQPFPLAQGNTFGYTFSQRTSTTSGPPYDIAVATQCTVGATTPAASGMTGEQTAVQCTQTFSNPGLKPQQLQMYWYSAAGCFVQNVGSP